MRAPWFAIVATCLLAACAPPAGDALVPEAAPAARTLPPADPQAAPSLTVALLADPGSDSPFRWEPVLAEGERTRRVGDALWAPAKPVIERLRPGTRVALEGARLRVDGRVLALPVHTIDRVAFVEVAPLARHFGAHAHRHPDDGSVALWPAETLAWLAAHGDPRAPVLVEARAAGLLEPAATTAVPEVATLLRVRNEGPADARALRVQFLDAIVDFGDVAAGTTTAYRAVPGGVYGYAAYRLRIDGREVTVPVIDWVGEKPLPGAAYTYVVAVDPAGDLPVGLLRVDRDR